jgi:hypothetical protein
MKRRPDEAARQTVDSVHIPFDRTWVRYPAPMHPFLRFGHPYQGARARIGPDRFGHFRPQFRVVF